MNTAHPTKTIVPLAEGLAWTDDGAIYQEKLDGQFDRSEVRGQRSEGGILIGERMGDGRFVAFDCAAFEGRDVLGLPTLERCALRDELCRANGIPIVPESRHGGALLREVIARGGEGVVRKLPDAPYSSAMIAAKKLGQWRCEVVAIGSSSVELRDCATGEARGKVALRGGKIERVRAVSHGGRGSILKIEGLELTARGLIRDPRPCQDAPDSWLVAY